WRAVFECESDRSVHLYLVEITIDFEYKSSIFSNPLWLGLIAGGGGLVLIIIIVVVAVSVSKRKKKIPSR
ncbi:MAG: GGIII-like transmembrane region-containing protein, partial [Candidatus Heimdallarchaeota archaeon]